jgi:hypothetical protein
MGSRFEQKQLQLAQQLLQVTERAVTAARIDDRKTTERLLADRSRLLKSLFGFEKGSGLPLYKEASVKKAQSSFSHKTREVLQSVHVLDKQLLAHMQANLVRLQVREGDLRRGEKVITTMRSVHRRSDGGNRLDIQG